MFIDNLMNKFGYSEMYEWSELFKFDIVPYGRFVAFDSNDPGKIKLANSYYDHVVGVTTINAVETSDNPEEWQGKYLCNEFGDIYLAKHDIATAQKDYDDINEMPYVATIKQTQVSPIINQDYDSSKQYVKRSNRNEWIRVNLLGKCIVVDDGTCMPGHKCTVGQNGIAMLNKFSDEGYYVLSRLTENTIMIFFK